MNDLRRVIVKNKVIFLLVLLGVTVSGIECTQTTNNVLKHVFVLGKAPKHTPVDYPGMPELAKSNEADLTQLGAEASFEDGRYLVKQYGGRLGYGESWNEGNYWVTGLPHKLNKKAALVLGAGLRNEKSGEKTEWTEYEQIGAQMEKWLALDLEKYYSEENCPAYYKHLKNLNKKFKSIFKKYETELKIIAEKYNKEVSETPEKLWQLHDTLSSMTSEKPDWVTEQIMKALKHIARKYIFLTSFDENLKKLSGGRVVDQILTYLKEVKAGSATPNKSPRAEGRLTGMIFSQTLLGGSVGAFSPQGTQFRGSPFDISKLWPEDGAMLVFEYLENNENSNERYVKVLFQRKQNHGLQPVHLPGCGACGTCTYDIFTKLMEKERLGTSELSTACKQEVPEDEATDDDQEVIVEEEDDVDDENTDGGTKLEEKADGEETEVGAPLETGQK